MDKSRLVVLLMLGICAVARAADSPAADPLDAALEQRIRGQVALEDVEIAAEWQRDEGNTSVKVWGSGVGVWKDRTQFHMAKDEFVSLLKMLSAAKVGSMRPPGAQPTPASAKAPIRVLGELTVVVGSERKSLRQLTKGGQSEPLRELVLGILSFCEKAAKTGVTASSLQDGLEKLAAGTLAPETFEAVVQYREDAKGGRPGESWLLRMNGLRITDRLLPKGQAPPPPRTLTLSRKQFQRITRVLEESDPETLPNNPYAASYTDVRLEVLGRDRTIPARAYLGITPETYGDKQKSFDRVVEGFRGLHDLVQREGALAADDQKSRPVRPVRPAATPAPTSSPAAP